MANSRSNIYPVQLQGAELNLNKLDAEIKQYSGFNKNNAPFVGGCLSNIFTKDETIEGATSKNTYIAPNGDVYRVTTEGLFKNGEKVLDTTGYDFFNIEELSQDAFPENAYFIYDERAYIIYENKTFKFVVDGVKADILQTVKFTSMKYYISRKVINDDEYYFIIMSGTIDTISGTGYLMVCKKNIHESSFENVYTINLRSTGYQTNILIPYIILSNDSIDNFRFLVLSNDRLNNNAGSLGVIYTLDSNGITVARKLSYENVNINSGVNIAYFVFTNKHAYYIGSGVSGYSYFVRTKGNQSIIFDYTVDFDAETNVFNLDAGTYVSAKRMSRVNINSNFSISNYWGVQYNFAFSRNNGSEIIPVTVDSDVGNVASVINTYNLRYITGGLVNDCVLTNNGIVTGLSLPGGWVLASEWNSVDADYIFFGENNEEWQNNKYVYLWKDINTSIWYKLVKSTPKLKIINNQIIINSNSFYNSYDISRNKKLLFAPAWNNRSPKVLDSIFDYGLTIDINSTSSIQYASAINEYDLDDNSSIIINPVTIVGMSAALMSYGSIPYINDSMAKYNSRINYYYGEIECKYRASYIINMDINWRITEYTDFLFPTNTDGNIQYSPSLFAIEKGKYGNLVFISEGGTAYKLMTYDNKAVMSYFLSTAIEGLQDFFTIQGQLYGILDNQIYNFSIVNEIANRGDFIVSVEGLQFVGNTPYEALFFSKTNRCLYSFTGANVLNAKQFVDKISEVRNYKYNPATQSIFLITDIGVIVYSLFGIYLIEFLNCQDMYLLNNGVILTDNEGTFKYVKYYKEETAEDYTKENITLETCFYGINNQTVTINDCLYMRIFSEEHEEGDLEVSATTLSLEGRMTEKTTFKIKASDWDAITHTIYLRYQPKEQRGLGISFSINSPFKIASLSIGSQADAILVDKVSKGAINAPQRTSNNVEW